MLFPSYIDRRKSAMDRFVKGFIVMSIVYLGTSTVLGLFMLGNQNLLALKFVHSHLNMLGWVSMMIYGVGYHILPRFMGRPLYSNKVGQAQFYLANISLIGMLLFYTVNTYTPGGLYRMLTVAFGAVQAVAIFLFFYNMLMTLLTTVEQQH
jgi:cytochrome c oxidase cbb3-type subunit 1